MISYYVTMDLASPFSALLSFFTPIFLSVDALHRESIVDSLPGIQ